eukprot:gene8283-10177_t
MGRFGVNRSNIRQADSREVEVSLLYDQNNGKPSSTTTDKKNAINKPTENTNTTKKLPLSQLSITSKQAQIEELVLKRPSFSMAWSMIKQLIPYYWNRNTLSIKLRVVLCVTMIFIAKGINLTVPLVFKGIINGLPGSPGSAHQWALLFVLTVVQKSIWDLRDVIFQKVSDSATLNISLQTFDHLHNLSLSYHLSRRTGSLLRIVERGTNSIILLLSLLLFNIFPTLVELFTVSVFLMFSYGSTFAVINIFSCFIYITFTLVITEWRNQYRKLANKKENEANDIRVDSLVNYENIKHFTSEEYERGRYNNLMQDYFQINMKSKLSYFLLNFGQSSIITVASTIGLMFATYQAAAGNFSIGDIIAINAYIAQMFSPLTWLGSSYRMILQSFADMENLIDLLNTKSEVVDAPDAEPLQFLYSNGPGFPSYLENFNENGLPSIEFRDVSFSYKTGGKLLDNISFRVPPGKSVAIVGPTGSGKSTIFRLLCRFYDVESGQIIVGNQDIRNVTQKSLRGAIGVVPQDTVLFNDTIAFNIGFGRREASDEELIEAAAKAQILDFIQSSPEGFSTIVGERGLRLSGGEKQRVAIARTLLKNPPILILDEATSALDSKTEKKIQQSLNEISKGRTTLVIAHRLSTIVHCDEIIVLKNGCIVEKGNHQQLLELGAEYSSLWYQQLEHPDSSSSSSSSSSTLSASSTNSSSVLSTPSISPPPPITSIPRPPQQTFNL